MKGLICDLVHNLLPQQFFSSNPATICTPATFQARETKNGEIRSFAWKKKTRTRDQGGDGGNFDLSATAINQATGGDYGDH